MSKCILFGAGQRLRTVISCLNKLHSTMQVSEIWDNKKKGVVKYGCEYIKIVLPHMIADDIIVVNTVDRHENDIVKQLVNDFQIPLKNIKNWRFIFNDVKESILDKYSNFNDENIKLILNYLQNNNLHVFNNGLYEKYYGRDSDFQIEKDSRSGLLYSWWNGKKIFLKRSMSVVSAQEYLNDIRREQDEKSPHCYNVRGQVKRTDHIVIDAGASEGFFALDFIDYAKKIYIVEHDEEWIEALSYTFASYSDKVTIFNKWLGKENDDSHITVDAINDIGEKISFIKMNMEGAEQDALLGADNVLCKNDSVELRICTYYNSEGAEKISRYLLDLKYQVKFSEGYMFFPFGDEILPELRHGILVANKVRKLEIYLWGIGEFCKTILDIINRNNVVIKGIIDIRYERIKEYQGIQVFPINKLLQEKYDYVVVTAKNTMSILKCCRKMKLYSEKVLLAWHEDLNQYNFIDKDAYQLMKCKCAYEKYYLRSENAYYEYSSVAFPIIHSAEEAINRIIRKKCSLCRFGDGEFEVMRNKERAWFQKKNNVLAKRLCSVIRSSNSNVLIGVANNFGNLERYTEEAADAIRKYIVKDNTRRDVERFLAKDVVYYDAYVTRPYMMYKDKSYACHIFDLWKLVWDKRDVVIVEGKSSRMGVNNDLLGNCNGIERILCPDMDAFSVYNDILLAVCENVSIDKLLLISLGATATVLAYDLAEKGYQAIDIGQLDNEYDWYCMGAEERCEIQGKMVAEVTWGHDVVGDVDSVYLTQILSVIE